MPYRMCILFCCCLLFGCGSPRPYDVRVVITLDGEPLTNAEISLQPIRENAASASGITDMAGEVTFKTGDIDGVFPNSYVVVVSKTIEEKRLSNNEIRALAEAGIRYSSGMVELVPEKYTRCETSDLKMKIGYWSSKDLTFDLWSGQSPQ